jgi:hypothetical protein
MEIACNVSHDTTLIGTTRITKILHFEELLKVTSRHDIRRDVMLYLQEFQDAQQLPEKQDGYSRGVSPAINGYQQSNLHAFTNPTLSSLS